MRPALLLLLLLVATALRAEAPPRLRAARIAPAGDGVAVALSLSAPTPFVSFTLGDPPRLVLDFPRLDWAAEAPPPAGLAAGLRFGLAAPDRSRLVIDLAGPARLAAARWRAGPTLVLTLAPTTEAAFRAGAGWPPGAGPARARPDRPLRVALDPGHGGVDPGAVRGGLDEKTLTLAFARQLAPALEAAGFAVTLTREADVFTPLAERVARARAAGADLLLSLHADVVVEGDASGVSVYLLDERASDPQAAALALRENAADARGGGAPLDRDVAEALAAMVSREVRASAKRLGAALVAAFAERVLVLEGRPLRAAAFRVLKGPDLPSALIELGFLSNAEDRARLQNPAWRARAVEAVVAAVADWAAAEPPRRGAVRDRGD